MTLIYSQLIGYNYIVENVVYKNMNDCILSTVSMLAKNASIISSKTNMNNGSVIVCNNQQNLLMVNMTKTHVETMVNQFKIISM